MKERDFKKVPLVKLTAVPEKNGFYELLKNRYWIVTEDNCILLYKGLYPQCSPLKDMMIIKANKDAFKNTRVELIENAWMPHNCYL